MDQELLTKLNESGINLIEFVETEAPQLMTEILYYGYWNNMLFLSFGIVLMIMAAMSSIYPYKHTYLFNQTEFDYKCFIFCICIGCIFVCIPVSIGFICTSIIELMKIQCSPRLYILQEIRGFI